MRKTPTLRRDDGAAGFSQLEILIGVTILMLIMAAVGTYYKYNIKAAKRSDAYYVSSQLAAAALEDAKGDISNPDTLKTLLDAMADTTLTRSSTVTQQGKAYTVNVKMRKVSPSAKLMRIKAYVKWDGTRGNAMGTVYPFE